MRCVLSLVIATALNLGVKNVRTQPEDFFTEDPQAMNDLSGPAATVEGCHPKCTWKCESAACEEACEPLCAPPKCETSCEMFDATQCKQTCDKPSCAVVCPEVHCESGECPTCKTICSPPTNCLTTCPSGECGSRCADPECQWKCKPRDDCPAPSCRMMCEQPKDCFQQAGGKTVPKAPDTTIVSQNLASLDVSSLGQPGGGNSSNASNATLVQLLRHVSRPHAH